MSWEPLRFLHAAGLWLDHPLSGTGPLPDGLRRIAEDATLTAFDRLVDVAIERQVDFVLLAGDTFDEGDGSLRAQVALAEGCGRLAEQQIPVFVLPGRADPALAWQALGELPPNVTCLRVRDEEPAAFVREGRVAATIARAAPPHSGTQRSAGRAEPTRRPAFSIGLMYVQAAATAAAGGDEPFDYLALGGHGQRQTIRTRQGLAHHPGPLQGLDRNHTGQHGFALVEVDQGGAVHRKFIPAAPVRWQQFPVRVDAETSRDRLLEIMDRELSACRAEPGELLWLAGWHVMGSGPLAGALTDEPFQRELRSALASIATGINVPVWHTLHVLPEPPAAAPSSATGEIGELSLDFARFHREVAAPTVDELAAVLSLEPAEPAEPADACVRSRLQSLAPHVDRRWIDDESLRLGLTLFS
ncbi:MAG TPA: hypothetical protein VML55_13040 [Planctomycetaceae bacterium]|nr:hypothetical protein [Planctomycetaceae bacterium]